MNGRLFLMRKARKIHVVKKSKEEALKTDGRHIVMNRALKMWKTKQEEKPLGNKWTTLVYEKSQEMFEKNQEEHTW